MHTTKRTQRKTQMIISTSCAPEKKKHKVPCEEHNSFHSIMILMSTSLFLGFYSFVISSKTFNHHVGFMILLFNDGRGILLHVMQKLRNFQKILSLFRKKHSSFSINALYISYMTFDLI